MSDPKKATEAEAEVPKLSQEVSEVELEQVSGGADAKPQPQPQPFLKFEFKTVFTT